MLFGDNTHESDEETPYDQLEEFKPDLEPEDETNSLSPQEYPTGSQRAFCPQQDPGLSVLGLEHFHTEASDSPSDTLSNGSAAMTDQGGVGPQTRNDEPASEQHAVSGSDQVDAKALAAAALAKEADAQPARDSREPAKRVDSAQEEVPHSGAAKLPATPLKLQTSSTTPKPDDSIATSPTLAKHAIPVEQGNVGTLPALQPTSPTTAGAPASPQSERLPSFRQMDEIAHAATRHDGQLPQYSHHHSQSFGSATATSPGLPYHFPPPSTQMSPNSQYALSARSPQSAIDHYSSPTQYPGNAYYMERRTSAIHDHPIGLPASLPSASSSGESHGPASSSTDGYSTNHTTPIDSAVMAEGMQRSIPILPPPRGMQPQTAAMLLNGFKCDYPGCEAAPFATQYLLSSHKNVHSSARPHYCSVEGCPRSEAGRGFKRKNEMIRHGLVHNSPGYICPFCPEREHKYPRPDNLQRHVRVHHAEKDRDDPLLRDVLNQRLEGPLGKSRRKRANTGPGPC